MQNARTPRFPITLTKSEALRIQSEQLEHYATMFGQDVRAIVAQATHATRLVDGREYDVVEVNRYIPRGGGIEHLISHLRGRAGETKTLTAS